MAGYSKRSLVEKLGLSAKGGSASGRKEDQRSLVISHPDNYQQTLGKIPKNVVFERSYRDLDLKETYDFIQFFVTSHETLKEVFPKLKKHLDKA